MPFKQGLGGKGAKANDGKAKRNRGRDLHDADPARILYRARRFQTKQRESGWPVLFALFFFSGETEFRDRPG